MSKSTRKSISILILLFIISQYVFAHNGEVAYAFPLPFPITIDGDFSDWSYKELKYYIKHVGSDTRPASDADFSGFFQVGYRMDNKSLYIAFTITDDDFIEDTSENVRFNTQDCLELCIDGRHLQSISGVASFMYSKKLRNQNNAYYDPFARNAKWNIAEVAHVQKGNTRYYEWRLILGEELVVGKTIGLDFQVFDKDSDGSFTFSSWGKGGSKFMNPEGLGDVVLLPSKGLTSRISGQVRWDKAIATKLPGEVRIRSVNDPKTWIQVSLDSLGRYRGDVPIGKYEIVLGGNYFIRGKNGDSIFSTKPKRSVFVNARRTTTTAPDLIISSAPAPDLIPDKGVLLDFTSADAGKVDNFMESYQKYYGIPGMSLALIKDSKVAYYKTYGVCNTMTGQKVDENTLFEAASVTKPVFSFAVLRLAERGVIDLDKPLYQYLPYPDIENDERYKLITARHVLIHRTGFPNWRYMNADNKLNILFTPGAKYNYSGEGFEYLKMVVEKITGKKVNQVLKEEVIEPMGLWHTFFSRNDSLRQMVADGHFGNMPRYDELPESPGMAWSMHTEAKIFTKFMLYMLEQRGLSDSTYRTMFSRHSDFNFDPGEEHLKDRNYMGISLEIRETPWGKSFGHGGNNGDFRCHFEVYKDTKMGYVLFTNSSEAYPLLEVMRKFLVEGKWKP